MPATRKSKRKQFFSTLSTAGVILLRDFATPVAFFITFRLAGAKPAISLALGTTLIQISYHWWKGIRFSPFFILASTFTTLFGGIDLFIDQPRYFRLEPFAQNAVMGTLFLATLFFRIPIISWFAGALPAKIRPDFSKTGKSYLWKLTLVWSIYFYAKSLVFLYLALTVDLGELIILRSLIGSLTLAIMFAGEIFYRRWKHPRA